jgi:TrmH family RNA methyltransferase
LKAIASDANAHFKRWLRLAGTPRAVRASGQTLAEGMHLAQAALAAGAAVDEIVLRRGARAAQVQALVETFAPGIERYEVAARLYDRIAPVAPGSGLLLVLRVPETPLPQGRAADMLYLDGVQDPGNAGTLIRTAAAAGVRHVLASEGTAALWSPRVLRAGMGAHFHVGLHEHVAPELLAAVLDGEWVVAVAHDARAPWDTPLDAPALGWIFGAEGQGPSTQALAVARRRVRIPAAAAVESLNVAAAAAVCLFERVRQKGLGA